MVMFVFFRILKERTKVFTYIITILTRKTENN